MSAAPLIDFIYIDAPRVRSLAAQLEVGGGGGGGGDAGDPVAVERLVRAVEPAILARGATTIDGSFDFAAWTPDAFRDGQFVRATGVVRLLDFDWLAEALAGLPAVLRKMSKLEMEALRASDEGRRMSKSQLNQRSQENQAAIARVEEFKVDELTQAVGKLYGDVVRVKVRPNPDQPGAVLVGSAYARFFRDAPAALSQKYGVEVDAGWAVLGQLNVPRPSAAPQPIRTGNQMEDAFEQIAMLMNNTFRIANAPAFPNVSFTPLAIYRTVG